MKRTNLIIFALFLLISAGQLYAQDALPYRQFQAFNKDTIQYLDYNFTLRGDQYVDKPAGDLLRDLELPIVYVSRPIMQLGNNQKHIYIVAMDWVIRLFGNINDDDRDSSKDYYIRIALKNAMTAEDFVNALNSDGRNKGRNGLYYCTPQFYEALKDFKLEHVESNYFLFKDRRRILLESKTIEDLKQLNKIIETEKANWRIKIRTEKQAEKNETPAVH